MPIAGGKGISQQLSFTQTQRAFPAGRYTRFLLVMCEDGYATLTLQVESRVANAVIRRRARRNSRINLHDCKNVIVLGQGGRVLASNVRDILEPVAGFRV